jgi:hypothetical protein
MDRRQKAKIAFFACVLVTGLLVLFAVGDSMNDAQRVTGRIAWVLSVVALSLFAIFRLWK